MGGHTQQGSIVDHLRNKHKITGTIRRNQLLDNLKIIGNSNNFGTLRLLEALYIKKHRPEMNTKEEGSQDLLKIFKH